MVCAHIVLSRFSRSGGPIRSPAPPHTPVGLWPLPVPPSTAARYRPTTATTTTMSRQMQGSSWVTRTGRTVFTGTPRSESGGSKCCFKVILGLLLVAIPGGLLYLENYQRQLELAFDELEGKIVEVDPADAGSFPRAAGTPVYFTSGFTGSASDHDFGLTLDHALKLKRESQYCQWKEYTTESCEQCRNDDGSTYQCNCATTYHYHLGWEPYPIISAFFDQPFNHNNPQRDPFPSVQLASTNTVAGEMFVEPKMLLNTRGTPRVVQFLHPGQPPPSYSFWKFFGWRDNQRYESTEALRPLMQSPAFVEHEFTYTGNEGWFFSPYESSMAGELLRKMGQFMEGSLFDWQLADLMPGCHAGDIRSRFHVVDPRDISVVGKFVPQPTPRVDVIDNLASSSVEVGLVHAGEHTYSHMVDAENWNANVNSWLARAAMVVLWTPVSVGIGAFDNWVSALGGSLLVLSLCWAAVYGISDFSGPSTSLPTILLFVASGLLLAAGQLTGGGASRSKRND